MSASTSTPCLDQLEDVRQRARDAQARVLELQVQRTRSVRALDEARAPLLAYYEELGAGDREADESEEARLLASVRDAEAVVTLRVEHNARGGNALGLVAVDERTERLLAGAMRALEERRQDVERFMREHFDALAAELAVLAVEARDAVDAALPILLDAEARYRRVRAKWRPILEANRVSTDLPANPLRGWADELAHSVGVPLPVPAFLLENA